MKRLLPRWPVLFLALVPLLVLWPAVFGGQAIGPWNHIRSMAPWNEATPAQPWDVLQADGVLQFAPWRSLVFDAWSHGQIPAWNNYQLMGTPLLANSQSAGFYPLHILMGVLHVPLYPAMTFLAWFHLFWAGLGVYLLIRRLGGTKTGGVIGGASFAMSAFMVYWTALPSVITTVSWIPWALACTIAFFQTDSFWGIAQQPRYSTTDSSSPSEALNDAISGVRAHRGWAAGLMGSVAMMVLAGHLQFLAFGLLAVAVVGIAMAVRLIYQRVEEPLTILRKSGSGDPGKEVTLRHVSIRAGFHTLLSFGFAVAVGICIAGPQLLPVLQFGKQSHRRSPPTAEGYAAYTSSAIQPFEWAGLEFPKLLGDPSESIGDPQNHSLFWAALAKRGDAFGESALGIGPLVLFLLCLLPKIGWKRGVPIALVGVLGILIACGTPFDYLLYYLVPGWSSTGSPGRAIVLFVMAACCLGGLAIQPKDPKAKTWNFRGLAIFAAISIVFNAIAILGLNGVQSFIPGLQLAPIISQSRAIAMPMFLISAIIAVGTGAWWLSTPGRAKIGLILAAPLVPVLLTLGVLRFGIPIEPASSPKTFERFAYLNKNWNLFETPRATMPPNLAALLRIHDAGGYDSLLNRDTKSLLDAANKQDSSPPENGNMMLIKDTADESSLINLGVSALVTPSQTMPMNGNRFQSGGIAEMTGEDYRSASLKADGPAQLTLMDRNMPGWTAAIDGKSEEIQPGPFRKVDVPNGTHLVEFRYWPPGLTAGLILCGLGFLPFLACLLQWRGTRRSPSRN